MSILLIFLLLALISFRIFYKSKPTKEMFPGKDDDFSIDYAFEQSSLKNEVTITMTVQISDTLSNAEQYRRLKPDVDLSGMMKTHITERFFKIMKERSNNDPSL